jgi:hypothetical protein
MIVSLGTSQPVTIQFDTAANCEAAKTQLYTQSAEITTWLRTKSASQPVENGVIVVSPPSAMHMEVYCISAPAPVVASGVGTGTIAMIVGAVVATGLVVSLLTSLRDMGRAKP